MVTASHLPRVSSLVGLVRVVLMKEYTQAMSKSNVWGISESTVSHTMTTLPVCGCINIESGVGGPLPELPGCLVKHTNDQYPYHGWMVDIQNEMRQFGGTVQVVTWCEKRPQEHSWYGITVFSHQKNPHNSQIFFCGTKIPRSFPWVFLGFSMGFSMGFPRFSMSPPRYWDDQHLPPGARVSIARRSQERKVSGRPLVGSPKTYGKSPFLMGKSSISNPKMLRTYTLVNLEKTMERSTMLWKWVNDIYFDWAMFTGKLFVDQRVTFMERLSHGSKSSSSDDNSENYDMVVSPHENWIMTIRLSMTTEIKPWWLVDTGLGNFSHLGRLCCRARGLGSSIPISGFSPFLPIKTSIYCNEIHFLIQVYTQHQFFHRFILKSSNFAADSSCFLTRTSYKSPRRCLDRGISHPKLVI